MKDVGLIRHKGESDICGRDMTWSADPTRSELFRWRCRKGSRRARCRGTASIKHGSWFQKSNLIFLEILLITYGIVCRESAHQIQNELSVGKQTVTDWGHVLQGNHAGVLGGLLRKNWYLLRPRHVMSLTSSPSYDRIFANRYVLAPLLPSSVRVLR